MRNQYYSIKDWVTWKSHIRDFYKTYLFPESQEVILFSIRKLMEDRAYISVEIFGRQIADLSTSEANESVVCKRGIELLEKLNFSILRSQLKNILRSIRRLTN